MRFRTVGGSLARAARSLVTADEGDGLTIVANEGGNSDPAPAPDPEPEPAPAPDPAPEAAPSPEPARSSDPTPEARAADRVAKVFASEHSQGRERQAAKLLANDKLSVEEITDLLADMPKGGSANGSMLERLAEQPNPEIKTGSEAAPNAQAESDAIWDLARARNGGK